MRRLRLPVCRGGSGLRSMATVAPAAFCGAACAVLPDMIGRKEEEPGFMPALADILGDASLTRVPEEAYWVVVVQGRPSPGSPGVFKKPPRFSKVFQKFTMPE